MIDDEDEIDDDTRDIVEDFLLDLKILSQDYGKEEITAALKSAAPGLFDASTAYQGAIINEGTSLTEARSLCDRIPNLVARTACKAAGWGKDKIMGFLGVAVGAGGAALGTAVKAQVDQDVDIVDQSGPPLKVSSSSLERMIATTNSLLANLTDMAQAAYKEMDDSVDFLASTVTGDSLASVKGAQATGAERFEPDMERAAAPAPKRKQKKKEKETK